MGHRNSALPINSRAKHGWSVPVHKSYQDNDTYLLLIICHDLNEFSARNIESYQWIWRSHKAGPNHFRIIKSMISLVVLRPSRPLLLTSICPTKIKILEVRLKNYQVLKETHMFIFKCLHVLEIW